MSNYLKICQDVRAQAGISGSGPSTVVGQVGIMADVVRWVDEAYNEIQTMHENFNFMHNNYTFLLTAGNESYNPILLVGDNNGVGVRTPIKDTFIIQEEIGGEKLWLKYMPWSVWQQHPKRLESNRGKPEIYTEDPSGRYHFYPYEEAQLDPLDDVNYNITFSGYARPDVLEENADEPVIPVQYQELIKIKAIIRYAEYYNSPEIMKSAMNTFRTEVKRMEYSELPRENLITPPFVAFA